MITHPDETKASPLPDILNPGMTVQKISAKRLKLYVYGSKYLRHLSCPINYAVLARTELDQFDAM